MHNMGVKYNIYIYIYILHIVLGIRFSYWYELLLLKYRFSFSSVEFSLVDCDIPVKPPELYIIYFKYSL